MAINDMTKKIGFCHCCKRKDVELHKKSHILPSFMFNNIYGDDGKRLIEVEPGNWDIKSSHSDSPYEKWIFCKSCEKKHSAIESKASYLLNHVKLDSLKAVTMDRGEIRQNLFENIDISIIKRFWILNLFRADLSNRSLFKMVSLGPHAETFRLILNEELPLEKSNMYIHIFVLRHLMKDLAKLSSPIYKTKVGDKDTYLILIDGIGYLFHFGKPEVKLLQETYFDVDGKGRVNIPNRRTGKLLLDIFNFKSELIDKLP